MSKQKKQGRTKLQQAQGITAFRLRLAEADRVALEMLAREGILMPSLGGGMDDDFFDCALEDLAKRFSGGYATADVDNCMHFEEAEWKMEACYLIGLAMGMRLHGVNLGALSGGAR